MPCGVSVFLVSMVQSIEPTVSGFKTVGLYNYVVVAEPFRVYVDKFDRAAVSIQKEDVDHYHPIVTGKTLSWKTYHINIS